MNIVGRLRPTLVGAALATLVLIMTACEPAGSVAPGTPSASITLSGQKHQDGGDVIITGTGFRPHASITITCTGVPWRTAPMPCGQRSTDANGRFEVTEFRRCSPEDPVGEGSAMILFTAKDDAVQSGQMPARDQLATARIAASYWLCH